MSVTGQGSTEHMHAQPSQPRSNAAPVPQRWHNRVPAWIWQSPAANVPEGQRMKRATAEAILQAMANRGSLDSVGNVVRIMGGKSLAKAARVSEGTLHLYIAHFIEVGAVVLLSRGGILYGTDDRKGFSAANIYGMPAAAGSLDYMRVSRRAQTMKPTGKTYRRKKRDGTFVDVPAFAPDVTRPGAQSTLWPQQRQPSPEEAGYAQPGQIGAVGRQRPSDHPPHDRQTTPPLNVRHHHPPCEHPDGPMDHGRVREKVRHGSSGRRRGPPKKNAFGGPCIENLEDRQILHDDQQLLDLWKNERQRGAVRCEPWQFIGAAIRAVEVAETEGGSALAIFAGIVNQERWLFITDGQQRAAHARLDATRPAREATSFVRGVERVADSHGLDPFHVARQSRPGLRRCDWDALVREAG